MSDLYVNRGTDANVGRESREVWVSPTGGHVCFRCPCGDRVCNLVVPPHKVRFDDDGILTVSNSIGSRGIGDGRPEWCHFHVKQGIPLMAKDARCPGSDA